MKNLKIRPAVSNDYPQIAGLIESPDELFLVFPAGHWPFNVRQVHRLAERRLDLTVCQTADDVIGFANLYDECPGKWVFIGNVIVHCDQRGQGIGRHLVRHMLKLVFEQRQLPEARISVFKDNLPALSLYQDLGFKQFAVETRKSPDGRCVELLHLKLKHRTEPA